MMSKTFAMLALPSVAAMSSCYDLKAAYQGSQCCTSDLAKMTNQTVLVAPTPMNANAANPCQDKKPYDGFTAGDGYFYNINCSIVDGVAAAVEQAGANVTAGYVGTRPAVGSPTTTPFWQNGMCAVNVHWHLGAEHYSVGEFDEHGTAPMDHSSHGRRMADDIRAGFKCHHYDAHDSKFTMPYTWKFCENMVVGESYEIHWPQSKAGACGTPNQYQTPFYDGVFCTDGIISLSPLNTFSTIGVQGQVFTIVNDEDYYYPDLFRGMIVDGTMGQDITYYTGSTTGTTRNNEICSQYAPITWQVDRKCHMISASSFDKMCYDMKNQRDDMSGDMHPHGARELVLDSLAADNHVNGYGR